MKEGVKLSEGREAACGWLFDDDGGYVLLIRAAVRKILNYFIKFS